MKGCFFAVAAAVSIAFQPFGMPSSASAADTQGWKAYCREDTIKDEMRCRVRGRDAFLIILPQKTGGYLYGFACSRGKDGYPGSTVLVRVDQNAFLQWRYGDFSPAIMEKFVAEMKSGSRLQCRMSEWPSGTNEVDISLDGFSVAYAEALARMAEYRAGR